MPEQVKVFQVEVRSSSRVDSGIGRPGRRTDPAPPREIMQRFALSFVEKHVRTHNLAFYPSLACQVPAIAFGPSTFFPIYCMWLMVFCWSLSAARWIRSASFRVPVMGIPDFDNLIHESEALRIANQMYGRGMRRGI